MREKGADARRLIEFCRLSRDLEHGSPQLAVRIHHGPAHLHHEGNGQMHVGTMPAPYHHPGLPRHARMHGVLGEVLAKDVVLRIRGTASNRVALEIAKARNLPVFS